MKQDLYVAPGHSIIIKQGMLTSGQKIPAAAFKGREADLEVLIRDGAVIDHYVEPVVVGGKKIDVERKSHLPPLAYSPEGQLRKSGDVTTSHAVKAREGEAVTRRMTVQQLAEIEKKQAAEGHKERDSRYRPTEELADADLEALEFEDLSDEELSLTDND